MTPWRPHPTAMDADARLLVCSPAAQAVAFRLASRAVAGRVAVGGNPLGAVRAICGGAEWAVAGFDELEQEGLVDRQGSAVALAWEWPVLDGQTAAVASTPDSTREDRAAEKRLRAHWSNASTATPEARAAWLQSPAGLRFLAREADRAPGADRSEAWALSFARTNDDNRGRFGTRGLAADGDKSRRQVVTADGDKHGDKSVPPPAPLSSEKKDKEGDDGARAGGDKDGDKLGDKIDAADAIVRSFVEGGGGNVVAPDLTTAQRLGAVLLACGVSHDEARAWGADLATPQGRKITWPWLRNLEREVDASFLRSCDMGRGEQPWCRVLDGLAAWRHTRAKRAKASSRVASKQQPPAPLVAAPPVRVAPNPAFAALAAGLAPAKETP